MQKHELIHIGLSTPAVGTAWASFLGYLPPLAAAVSIVWILVQAFYFFKDRNKGKR